MENKKHQKNELLKAYKNLWKMMNVKERVIFCILTCFMLLRCFAVIMTTQILACLVDVISGRRGNIFGFPLPVSWSIIQVIIFCHVLIAVIWLLSVTLSGIIRNYH